MSFLTATNMHFLIAAFLHFIIAADNVRIEKNVKEIQKLLGDAYLKVLSIIDEILECKLNLKDIKYAEEKLEKFLNEVYLTEGTENKEYLHIKIHNKVDEIKKNLGIIYTSEEKFKT